MLKLASCLSIVFALVLSSLCISYAALIDRGGGLIYDTDLDITWLQDANYAKTSGYDSDGRMTWFDAVAWTNQLEYNGLQGWRLPITIGTGEGAINEGEMGNIYYNEGISSSLPFPFINLISGDYWTGTEQVDNELAWNFHLGTGHQNTSNKEVSLLGVWAVRDGDVYPQVENSFIVPSSKYPTIQSAIDTAPNGHIIIVEDGTYTGQGNINLDFKGKAITVRSRNGSEYCIIDCEGNGRGFNFLSGETRKSKLDGFTIMNGESDTGGGIYIFESSPTIENCVIVNNRALFGGGIYNKYSTPKINNCTFKQNLSYSIILDDDHLFIDGHGGGIYNHYSSPEISECVITQNNGFVGGGIYNYYSSPLIFDCLIENNTSTGPAVFGRGYGGGIYNDNSSPVIFNCTFSENENGRGGGIFNAKTSFPTILDCIFDGNIAEDYDGDGNGGAITNDHLSSILIYNCIFSGNSAWYNAGIDNRGFLSVSNSTFRKNSSMGAGGIGNSGELNITNSNFIENFGDNGGGIANRGKLNITNSIFSGNEGYSGVAIYNSSSNTTITNCVFHNNQDEWHKGIIFNVNASPQLTNCIIWENSPIPIYSIYDEDESGSLPEPLVNYSNIKLESGVYPGIQNINLNPLFIDAANYDYHLSEASPCKDAGDNNAPVLSLIDLDDKPRIMDGVVDMGAYEYPGNQAPPVAYDADVSSDEDTSVDILLSAYDKDLIYEFSEDKTGGKNNFTAVGDSGNMPEPSTIYAEGDYSAYFEKANYEYLFLDNTSATINMPWKFGTLNKTGTVWLKFKADDVLKFQTLFSKHEYQTDKLSVHSMIRGSTGEIFFKLGYDAGAEQILHFHGTPLQSDTWYALCVSFEQNGGYSDSPEKVYMEVRTVPDGNIVGTNYVSNAFQDPDNHELNLSDTPYMIGASLSSGAISQPFNGHIDDVMIFNDKVVGSAFEQYAKEGFAGDPKCHLDFEHTPLTYSIVSQPSHGTLTGIAHNITYTPDKDFFGNDSFTFRVNDGYADSNIATVSIYVEPVNDAPVITGQLPIETESGVALEIALSDLIIEDADRNYPVGFSVHANNGPNYTVGGVSITPENDFTGVLTVPVYVNDGYANSNTYNLNITVDINDECPSDSQKTEPGICGCGIPDTDTDSDGTSDCKDNCPIDPDKVNPGTCGCGIPDTDSDNDGTANCADNCPQDSTKTSPGICGCGIEDLDANNDGVADCIANHPIVKITSPESDQVISIGESVEFRCDVANENAPYTFLWDFDDGASNVSVRNPGKVAFEKAGKFIVTVSVADKNGDLSNDKVTITVNVESGGGGGGGCFINAIAY